MDKIVGNSDNCFNNRHNLASEDQTIIGYLNSRQVKVHYSNVSAIQMFTFQIPNVFHFSFLALDKYCWKKTIFSGMIKKLSHLRLNPFKVTWKKESKAFGYSCYRNSTTKQSFWCFYIKYSSNWGKRNVGLYQCIS